MRPGQVPNRRIGRSLTKHEVVCTDGAAGQVRRVLVDRMSGAVTHVVVRVSVGLLAPRGARRAAQLGTFLHTERIELAASRDELIGLPEFRPDDDIATEMFGAPGRIAPSSRGSIVTRRGSTSTAGWCASPDESAPPSSSRRPKTWLSASAVC